METGGCFWHQSTVASSSNHAADCLLVDRSLDGDPEALASLKAQFGARLVSFLTSAGATPAEAEDIVGSLWADCTVGDDTRGPRLEKYHGKCSLYSWLKTVALNELIDQKRRSTRWREIEARTLTGVMETAGTALHPSPPARPGPEPPLLQIMRRALSNAMAQCPTESWVMLHLVHLDGLSQREVARMWGWHESKVSRAVSSAMELISAETRRAVSIEDPWLELQWSDFLDLCSCADFLLFS